MKVINRSDDIVTYALPELGIRREFNPGEVKEITENEIESLFQTVGGKPIVTDYLLVDNKPWVKEHFDAPIEYFWQVDEIKNCLLNDDIDLFTETLHYAPEGVLDLIKKLSYTIPITDLNKINAIKDVLKFDVIMAEKILADSSEKIITSKEQGRLRREEL